MSDINIAFPDGTVKQFPKNSTGLDIAATISHGLARNVLAAKINGEVWDALRPIENDASLQLLTWSDLEGKSIFWHSSAHLMAEALEALYPGIKFGIGPPIENGFYYDVDFGDMEFDSENLDKLESKIIELARQKNGFIRTPISKAEAIDYFAKKGDEYKLDLLEDLEDGSITFYQQGEFVDLCKGPHLPNTGFVKGGQNPECCRSLLGVEMKPGSSSPGFMAFHFPSRRI